MEKLKNARAVVISRSTFASSGHHNGHWLGDNYSTFQDLYNSIAGILTMQLFGLNFVGADICGFNGNTTEELCSRWMQLGTLYPFSRNHNSINQISQEPYAFGETLLNISIDSLHRRYTLLPYFYTLFASATVNATTVWRPLFFEFSSDANTYGIDRQFMIGSYLLVSPVLDENATSVVAYFPSGKWYSYYDGTTVVGAGQNITLAAPLTFIPIHVRAGAIIPLQGPALTTAVARQNPFTLLVALDNAGNAQGQLFLDDGQSLDTLSSQTYSLINFSAAGQTITSQPILSNYVAVPLLTNVTVFGVVGTAAPVKVLVGNSSVSFNYDATIQKVTISGLSINITSSFQISWTNANTATITTGGRTSSTTGKTSSASPCLLWRTGRNNNVFGLLVAAVIFFVVATV